MAGLNSMGLTPMGSASPAAHTLPEINDRTEQISRDFSIVYGRMRSFTVPAQSGRNGGTRQHGLTVCHARQCGSIKTAEGVKRITFDFVPVGRCVDKRQIEERIMTNQHGPRASR